MLDEDVIPQLTLATHTSMPELEEYAKGLVDLPGAAESCAGEDLM